jgi:hypothetical protein
MQHVHPEDFALADELASSTTFPVWLTFPVAGAWYLHVSVSLPSHSSPMGTVVEEQHTFKVGQITSVQNHTSTQKALNPVSAAPSLTALLPSALVPQRQRGIMHVPSLPPARKAPGAMYISLSVRGNAFWQHVCHRVVLRLTDATSGNDVDNLVPWLHDSMHVLIAPPAHETAPPHLLHKHVIPEALDETIFAGDKQAGIDPCNIEMHKVAAGAQQGRKGSMGPRLVMYIRFQAGGLHDLYVQVRLPLLFTGTSCSAELIRLRSCSHRCPFQEHPIEGLR